MGRPHILGVTCLSRFPNGVGNVLLDEYVTQHHKPMRLDSKMASAFLRFVAPIFLWNPTVPGITHALPEHGHFASSGSDWRPFPLPPELRLPIFRANHRQSPRPKTGVPTAFVSKHGERFLTSANVGCLTLQSCCLLDNIMFYLTRAP